LFLTFDLVLFGAFTRLTDSGLGCPDWPGCYGSVSPIGAHADISAAQAAMPTGPVTISKAWIEMIHRYLATAVGVLILVLASVSWVERKRLSVSHWWPMVTLVLGVSARGFRRAHGDHEAVSGHRHFALAWVAWCCWRLLQAQSVRTHWVHRAAQGRCAAASGTRFGLGLVFALLWLQIALGGWVSTNYAVLACRLPDLPGQLVACRWTCETAFALARAGHDTVRRVAIPFAALTAIHYVHRLSAYVVLLASGLAGLAPCGPTAPRHAPHRHAGCWAVGCGNSSPA
jgi:heme a synthase